MIQNKQTKEGKLKKKQFKGKITFFIRELQFHPNIWINPFREHELKSIVLEKWHVIDNNWCCRTYLQNVQEVSKKKKKTKTHKQTQYRYWLSWTIDGHTNMSFEFLWSWHRWSPPVIVNWKKKYEHIHHKHTMFAYIHKNKERSMGSFHLNICYTPCKRSCGGTCI